jgi:hypothetical protein
MLYGKSTTAFIPKLMIYGGSMSERLSRQELYDLAWSEPLRSLSARFGISDVALKETCAKAQIPTPKRGYWAGKDAGKNVSKTSLPESH